MVKRQGREAGHSPPSSAEVKNEWSCIFLPPPHMPSCRVQWRFYLYLQGTERVNMYCVCRHVCRCLLLTHLVLLKWVTGTDRQMVAGVLRCFSYWYKCDYSYCCFICSAKPCYGWGQVQTNWHYDGLFSDSFLLSASVHHVPYSHRLTVSVDNTLNNCSRD